MLVDTHCHIHDEDYPLSPVETLRRAHEAGVNKLICVGTSQKSSADALAFAEMHDDVYAAIGVHPHDTKEGWGRIAELALLHRGKAIQDTSTQSNDHKKAKLVAVGEIGLDYYYNHSSREVQITALEAQMQVAVDTNLPIIFHVRDAFDDFWPIFDNFSTLKGELHSFTDTLVNLEQGLKRGLFIGVNGISTFTKDTHQQQMFAAIPLERMLLETDAPFLTPTPKRGTVNEPAFVGLVAEYHAGLRGISRDEIARVTTANAQKLFAL